MPFFKLTGISSSSKKNKSTSAPSSPRSSVHLLAEDLAAVNKNTFLSPDEVLDLLHQKGTTMAHLNTFSLTRNPRELPERPKGSTA
ncbi:hypothetical protein BGX26_003468 [Mortierella sp. AD094]|nr:hypothetical protein BGX26_003468 [Mortierella sp. AD094]